MAASKPPKSPRGRGKVQPAPNAPARRPSRPTAQPASRPTFILPVPSTLELIAGAIVLVVLIGGGIALYGKGHADGYGAAAAYYQKLMAAQAAANQAAVDAANKQLLATADQLSKTEKDLDDALANIDAGSGGADAAALGLDAQRMRDLGTIH